MATTSDGHRCRSSSPRPRRPRPRPSRSSTTCPATWIDISATGTALNLADDASVDIATTIGNSLFAAGTARVGSNGAVRFAGAGPDPRLHERRDPVRGRVQPDEPGRCSPFWDDINTAGGTVGNIYWQETQGRLVVQWEAAGFFGAAASETATFQIQVPGTGPSTRSSCTRTSRASARTRGGSATIGYQSGGVTRTTSSGASTRPAPW